MIASLPSDEEKDEQHGSCKQHSYGILGKDIISILSGYLIQCNDEPRNPLNDCESGFKMASGGFIVKRYTQA